MEISDEPNGFNSVDRVRSIILDVHVNSLTLLAIVTIWLYNACALISSWNILRAQSVHISYLYSSTYTILLLLLIIIISRNRNMVKSSDDMKDYVS